MAIVDNENSEGAAWEEPTESDKELVEFVVEHCDSWCNYRDQNYLDDWEKYERLFRGQWKQDDKTRDSERSRIISPATQQAIETRHAEISEAIFGQGEYFDIEQEIVNVNGQQITADQLKAQLMEDFDKDKVKKAILQIELMAEIYGTGIGEIILKNETEYIPTTQQVPGQAQAAFGVTERDRLAVKLRPVNPKNFLIDPNADTIEEAMGCAIEKYVSLHHIVKGIENGTYRKVDIQSVDPDNISLEPTQEVTTFRDDKVKLLTYYGLVPREYLENLENDGSEVVDLFPEDSEADEYSDMVEAIIIIANGELLLKAEASPYMMKDRPIIAYQDDTVPGRFFGRGTAEKAFNMQMAIDGQLRAHLDSLALTTAPMVAMDATRLPRGAKFEIKPGKAILVNGNPAEILTPFHFGQTNGDAPAAAQNFERMLLQATGTLDSNGMVSQVARDASQGGISMAVASIIKKYKRTLTNFQEDFLIPFVKKAAYRYMQYDPERYPSTEIGFRPTATLGIIAREYEQQQFIALLQTLGPDTPILPVIMKGIVSNSSLSNKGEMMAALDKMSQPNPEQQQMQQQQQMLQMNLAQAQVMDTQASAQKKQAEAQVAMVEAQIAPDVAKAKVISALSNNLDDNNEAKDFERRVKLADLMIKEKDIASNERIAMAQMSEKRAANGADFVKRLSDGLNNA